MHRRLISFVKYNKVFLRMYRLLGNLLISTLKLIVKTDDKKILFMSFGGRKFDDSPKALYTAIKSDPYFRDYKLVWGFINPEKFEDMQLNTVRVDTLEFYITAISAHIWIDNSSVERGLNLRTKNTLEFNTWHGTPLKKMGEDISNKSYTSETRAIGKKIICAQSEYDREIFARLFKAKRENIILSDLPRNDSLLNAESFELSEIKRKIGIPDGKKVILYAPTFREYDRDGFNSCFLSPPIDVKKWKNALSNKYIVLFRAHYEVINILGIRSDGFFFDVSDYPQLDELIMVSDMLISDYSSIYFDYSITEKPMLNFAYDLDTYTKERGLYFNIDNGGLPCRVNLSEDTLLDEIVNIDIKAYSERCKAFKKVFAPNAGNATKTVISKMKELIEAS